MRFSISSIILATLFTKSYYALPASSINEVPVSTSGSSTIPPVAQTQFHATCTDTAAIIKSAAQSKTLALLPPVPVAGSRPFRNWPDEFSWSGGFYLTPKLQDALTYGATFLECHGPGQDGNFVVIEFTLDVEGKSQVPAKSVPVPLKVLNMGTDKEVGSKFRADQTIFGNKIRMLLDPKDKGGTALAFPTEKQIIKWKKTKSTVTGISVSDWTAYTAIQDKDVVVAAAKLKPLQETGMKQAEKHNIPLLSDPWAQVVLITDEGKGTLSLDFYAGH
ncbi:hypothetical protein DFH07DRAFT_970936 [Mycena maculata]|uniref:Uncharacterized protein n=1 Tax=Mycena maculata TaxID=230809 RepID=A0AAD7HQ32_9AGAR|nr:hypothetical protein DFH07DRAFT_970936 [Mycena maculata]